MHRWRLQVLNSYGLGYRLSSSSSLRDAYKQRVLTGAKSLYDFRWTVRPLYTTYYQAPSGFDKYLRRRLVTNLLIAVAVQIWHGA